MVRVPEKAILKEMQEHPWASRAVATRIARDHLLKPKTTTKEGKRVYQRNLMRVKRLEQRGLLNLSHMSLENVVGIDLSKVGKRR